MKKRKVLIFELADVNFASRARKEAFTLAKEGYRVTFLGVSKRVKKKTITYENNVRLIALPVNYSRKFVNIFVYNWLLFLFILRNKFDVYHLHNLNSVFVSVLIKIFSRKRLIFDAHELNYNKRHLGQKLRNRLITSVDVFKERLLLIFSDAILQANDKRADLFAAHYKCKKPFVIQNNEPIVEIDQSKSIRSVLDIPEDRKILMFTGNVTFGLNQSVHKIIESLSGVRDDVHLYILGNASNWVREKLNTIADNHQVTQRVHFLDTIPYNDVVHFISGADVAVVPIYATSLNSRFSALNKISQALMAGLPILSSNYEVFDELFNIKEAYFGETFDVEDAESIAQATNNIFTHDIKEAGKIARQVAEESVNWETEAQKLIKVYSDL